MDDLLLAYRFLFADDDDAILLLDTYLSMGHEISLENVLGNLKVKHFFELSNQDKITIEIEDNDKDINPTVCAQLLYAGLFEALRWPAFNLHDDIFDNPALFMRARQGSVDEVANMTIAATEAYLAGLSLANEGLDIVLAINEAAEGDTVALAAILPLLSVKMVQEGKKLIIRDPSGKTLATITSAAKLEAIREEVKRKRMKFSNKIAILEEAGVDQKIWSMLVLGDSISATIRRENLRRGLLRLNTKLRPNDVKYYAAHHDFPWELHKWFWKHGIDPNDAQYGRWIHVDEHQRMHGKFPKFNDEWRKFIFDSGGNLIERTKPEILSELERMRGLYPAVRQPKPIQ